MDRVYDRVERDDLLSKYLFGGVHEDHRAHVAAWWSEAFGGPARYTEGLGGYEGMLAHHREGSRLALHNSQPGAEVFEHAPVPRWGWGEAPPFEP
jgi:hemoglobin